jgi:signal transduction histidine kinase
MAATLEPKDPASNPPSRATLSGFLPRSLFAQVTLIIVAGLAIAQGLAFACLLYERGVAMRQLMMIGIERDLASSVAMLDRLRPEERTAWLERLERRNYRFEPGGRVEGRPPQSRTLRNFAEALVEVLRPFQVRKVAEAEGLNDGVQLEVLLGDGSPVLVHAQRVPIPVSAWVLWALLGQLAALSLCAWATVRLVTRPLSQLAAAADGLGPDLRAPALPESGPTEVAQAARAFNAMQRRIAGYMAERVEILASISHDLQTPITRMRLRADLMDEGTDRAKFHQDLEAMQALVREGVAYARTLHGAAEPASRVDADALFEALAEDYADTGERVMVEGRIGRPIVTRPHALRRILLNLLDNALKYGTDVRLQVHPRDDGLVLAVVDAGPGIPEDQLQAVLRPFHRVESSRNRSTGGTGLGLAIAQQLATAIGATLELHNRPAGGLEARLTLPT